MVQRIGRFEILETIGRGVAGTVYLARDPSSGREVAVETIDVSGPRGDELRELVLRRAGMAGRLVHGNVAAVHEVGAEGNHVFVVREYVDGQSLTQYIAEGAPFRPVAVIAWLDQIAAALDFAHERGIVHGGLEPSAVIVGRTGEVKVYGFGLARTMPRTAQLAGTAGLQPSYMSPEQIRGEAIDRATDVYAFGAVVYELVTGHAPFESESLVTSIFRAVNDPPIPPISLKPDLPEEVDSVLMRALEKSPGARFATCRELVDAFSLAAREQHEAVSSGAAVPGAVATGDPAATTPAGAVRYCDQCGAALRPGVKFCYRCGAEAVAPVEGYDTGGLGAAPAETAAPAAPAGTSNLGSAQPEPGIPPRLTAESPAVEPRAGEPRRADSWAPEPSAPGAPAVVPPPLAPAPPRAEANRAEPRSADTGRSESPRAETGRIEPSRIKPVTAPLPDTRDLATSAEEPVVVPVTPPAEPAVVPSDPQGRPVGVSSARPSGSLPPPLAGYARSTGTAELPPPEEVLAGEPARSKWRGPAVFFSVLFVIVLIFVLIGMWLAPRLLTPQRVPAPETSALVAHSAGESGCV